MIERRSVVRQLMILIEQLFWKRRPSFSRDVNDRHVYPLNVPDKNVDPASEHANDDERRHKTTENDNNLTTERCWHIKESPNPRPKFHLVRRLRLCSVSPPSHRIMTCTPPDGMRGIGSNTT